MKITVGQLRQVIAEEVKRIVSENSETAGRSHKMDKVVAFSSQQSLFNEEQYDLVDATGNLDEEAYMSALEGKGDAAIKAAVEKSIKIYHGKPATEADTADLEYWKEMMLQSAKDIVAKRPKQHSGTIERPGVDRDDWRSSPGARYSRMKKSYDKFYGPGGRPRY